MRISARTFLNFLMILPVYASSCLWLLLASLLVLSGCDDPIPGPIGGLVLVIRSFEATTDPALQNIARIEIQTQRVEVMHSNMVSGGSDSLVVDTQQRTIVIMNQGVTDRLVGQYQVPPGHVSQIRIFPHLVTLYLKDGTAVPLEVPSSNIPSWGQSGWKIEPSDGNAWPIEVDELTGVRALFRFDVHMLFNKGNGYKIKPIVQAERFTVNPDADGPGVFVNQLTVLFHRGVPRPQVDAINAEIDATVLRDPLTSNAYRMKLPASINVQDAAAFYSSKLEVAAILPAINFSLLDAVPPAEGAQSRQATARLPEAWQFVNDRTGKVGDWRIRVAMIDTPVDLTRIDLIPNTWINQGEIPPEIYPRLKDVDDDGIITFFDLNSPDNFNVGNMDILRDTNRNNCIDGVDLIKQWSNDKDDDRDDLNDEMEHREIKDDIVGYDFYYKTGSNFWREIPPPDDSMDTHGTVTAAELGAAANNTDGRFASCPLMGTSVGGPNITYAGAIWNVSMAHFTGANLLPQSGRDPSLVGIPDVSMIDALTYIEAKKMTTRKETTPFKAFDVASISLGFYVIADPQSDKNGNPTGLDLSCTQIPAKREDLNNKVNYTTLYDMPLDVFRATVDEETKVFRAPPWLKPGDAFPRSHLLWVWSAGNNSYDLSSQYFRSYLIQTMRAQMLDNVMFVGATVGDRNNISETFSNYGRGVVDLYAPGPAGTSLAAPMVAGVATLMISLDPCYRDPAVACTYRTVPSLIKRLLTESGPRNVNVRSVPPDALSSFILGLPHPLIEHCNLLEVNQPTLDAFASVSRLGL